MNRILVIALVSFLLIGCQEKYGTLPTASGTARKPASAATSQEPASASTVHSSSTTARPGIAPPQRVDGRIHGLITSQKAVTAGELGIMPADMTVYVVQVSVQHSEHSRITAGQTLSLYSKIRPPGKDLWMNVATYSTKTGWIVGFE